MRIAVEHRSVYRFTEPQARVVQMLRLTPCDSDHQTVVSWLIGVGCDARLRDSFDGLGNAVTMLYAEGPIEELEVTVSGEVLTLNSDGVIKGTDEPLPPLFYCRSTPRTKPDAALTEFVAEAAGEGDPLDRLHRLNTALSKRFPAAEDAPDGGRTAAEVFAERQVTSRGLAHVFLAGARSLGIPARYISGYRSDGEAHGAPHGWAEAHVDGLGWVGFDPALGISPDQSYVRVAVGLDADGAASIAGTRVGHGEEELHVDLLADRMGNEG